MIEPFTRVILDISEPSRNGRMYPSHAVEQAIKNANWSVPLVLGSFALSDGCGGAVNVDKIAGFARGLFLEGKQLKAEISVATTTPDGQLLETLLSSIGLDGFEFTTCGVGSVEEDVNGNYVVNSDYKLVAVSVQQKQAAQYD